MANQNQHIEDYLDAYRQMADTDFAVMITGPWGCGKSHFITHRFTESEHIYVSLNGVTDLANIDIEVFKAVCPVVGRKLLAILGRLVNEALKAKYSFSLADAIKLSDFRTKIGNKILIFDDLERCLLEPEQILGYINSYVEKKTKVVIIGEEDYINRQSNEKYRLIKEKVIGKTFRLSENSESLFGALVTEKLYPVTHTLIARNRDAVTQMFQKVCEVKGQCNYRALKHSFRDFEYFYPNIDAGFCKNSDFLDALLTVFVTLDYEVQLANLTVEDITRGTSDEDKGPDKQKTESKFKAVLTRHGLQDPEFMPAYSDLVIPREQWVKILQNVGVDKQALSEAFRNSKYFPEKQPDWVVLWHWHNLEDDVAADALDNVRKTLKTHGYRTRDEILHVFSILLGLAGLGAIPETKEDVVCELNSYLDVLLAEKKLVIPAYGERDAGLSGSHGLGYWREDSEEFTQLVAVICDALDKAVTKDTEESVTIWLSQLSVFPGTFYPKLEMNAEFSNQPVLNLFQPAQFLTEMVKIPNETKWGAQNLLIKRFVVCTTQLAAELPFLEGIIHEIDKRISESVGFATPTIANLTYLRNHLAPILPEFRKMAMGIASPSIEATIET